LATVLIVEDSWQLLEMLRSILQSEGLRVLVAPEPTAAAALIHARPVDAIVTDFFGGLTPEDCRQSVADILAAAGARPVLGVTGRPFEPGTSPREFGVDDLIAKPFDVDELVERVLDLVDVARQRQQAGDLADL
jgi:DNA-binding response OmpR family regulator